jgi:peptide/nickel transport system substrate-binding protein
VTKRTRAAGRVTGSALGRLLALAISAAMVFGIAGGASAQSSEPSTAAKTTLTMGFTYDLYTSNPFRVCGCGAEYEWLAMQYQMLLGFDAKNLGPTPDLATEVPTKENGGVSSDGLTWTFHIRKGETWTDGQPVTSHDVAWTYRYMLDNNESAYVNYLPFNPTFSTPDDYTFVWHLSRPNLSPITPPWIPILPEHIWDRFDGNPKGARQFENIPAVGSGPFHLTQWKQGQYWTMEANDDFWRGAPHVDEIKVRVFDNQEAMALALRQGEVDIVSGLVPNLANTLKNAPNIAVHEAQARGFVNLAFNFGGQGPKADPNPALEDVRVRQAISYAINRQALVDKVLLGTGEPGTSVVVPANSWHWQPPADELQNYDPDKANQLLDQAGYKDTNGDGIREDPKTGQPLELDIPAASSETGAVDSGKLIQDWLKAVGIGVKLRAVSDGGMDSAWTNGTFDAYIWGWNPDPDPNFILSIFATDQCKGWSDGCYSNKAYDKMFIQQQTTQSETERHALVDKMQQFIYEQAPELVLFYESDLEAYRTDAFTGWVPTPAPDGYYVFGYVPYSYENVRPVAAGVAGASTNSVPLWLWGVAVLAIVAVFVVIGMRRRRREDEQI